MAGAVELPVGLELDCAIARDVLGWTPVPGTKHFANGMGYGTDCFLPSKDLDDAWQVVEALTARDYSFTLSRDVVNQVPCQWWASFLAPCPAVRPESARAEAAPLAICRAALLAVRKA